jgi:hypothetical protein
VTGPASRTRSARGPERRQACYSTTVFTLRCTKKLLARLGASPALDDVEPTTRLGDWYANLLFRPGGQVVLFVNERTLLPVIVKARTM